MLYIHNPSPSHNSLVERSVACSFHWKENRFRSKSERNIPLAYNSQVLSHWLVPILARVRKVNCSTSVQTSMALTNSTVFLTYPVSNVEVLGELKVFLPSKDTLCWSLLLDLLQAIGKRGKREHGGCHGRFPWARPRRIAHNFCHILLTETQSFGSTWLQGSWEV